MKAIIILFVLIVCLIGSGIVTAACFTEYDDSKEAKTLTIFKYIIVWDLLVLLSIIFQSQTL